MTTEDLVYIVRATALVDEDALEEEDQEVPGDHTITLPASASTWSTSDQAKAVLDEFHDSVAVGMLEDFSFTVLNPEGVEIFEEFED